MGASFRDFVAACRKNGELIEISQSVDLRNVAALVPQSDKALLFTNVEGYSMPVVSGLLQSRKRLSLALGVPYERIEKKLRDAMEHPIKPKLVKQAAVREVILTENKVDLYRLPVPIFSTMDGGPMITGAVVIAEDPEYGMNAGMYRLMLKEKNITGIDIVTPNNLRRYAERALQAMKPLPVSISIGAHPYEMLASTFKAALGTNELGYAGGLRGGAVGLAAGETVPVPCIADAEIVLEGEILPEGWVHSEGPFCEFNRLMGGIHCNPRVRIKAVLHRRDPIYYALHMPWENIWMSAPIYEAAAWRVLREAGVSTTAINVTPGGCCHWHIIAAIKKQPGDGKNAILALLSIADIKHVVVTDDDIDIFDPVDVEWAIATRVQADRDVVVISNARSKPLDPSLPPSDGIPTTAKMGIDATIPENVPAERYKRIVYFNEKQARLKDYLGPASAPAPRKSREREEAPIDGLAGKIVKTLAASHRFFGEMLDLFPKEGYARIARAIGRLHQEGKITQDTEGKYQLKAGA
ncbi:MAG: UbiD family decarboxylase [Deltaproteobacteria bacterium]|nr:UbiD family decarboxylase [Deltaproteobacteria bacterium]MBI2992443.1 UbiD family decarboxylase [Deltaproteobacteria bacterium]MBI3061730.1 UbiD family decarboxylase [Deltaproteobacteria bacterium]